MALKRKYVDDDDFDLSENDAHHNPPLKRTRHKQVEPQLKGTSTQKKSGTPERLDYEPRSRTRRASRDSMKTRCSRADRIAAELANLADFNASPKPRGAQCVEGDDSEQRSRTRKTSKNPKKTHRSRADHVAAELDNLAKFNAPPKARGARNVESEEDRPEQQSRLRRTSKDSIKTQRSRADHVAAELANLADFNTPPHTLGAPDINSEDDEDAPPSQSTRRTRPIKGARVTKRKHVFPKPSISPRKLAQQNRLLTELASLTPWPHWESEPEDSSAKSDDEQDALPRHHSRAYPPKHVGVQNVPWSSLPAEMRNTIYEYCMEAEERKAVNIVHYPDGIPRRSVRGVSTTTNFAHSFWGSTQTCRQVREELTPWLLSKRHIRTPLATLKSYIELFHQRNAADGTPIGRIEPFCTGAPLPSEGIEILSLLNEAHGSSNFHLQLKPRPIYPMSDDAQFGQEFEQHDDLALIRGINRLIVDGMEFSLNDAGIAAIRLASVPRAVQEDNGSDDEDGIGESYDTLIKLDISEGMEGDRDKQLGHINDFLYHAELSHHQGLKIEAKVAGGSAQWVVTELGIMSLSWKARRRGGDVVSRLITISLDLDASELFTEVNL